MDGQLLRDFLEGYLWYWETIGGALGYTIGLVIICIIPFYLLILIFQGYNYIKRRSSKDRI